MCESLASRRVRVPYAFKYTPTKFRLPDNSLATVGESFGLTCATFVLAVFYTIKNTRIIQEETWLSRAEDAVWREGILPVLQSRHDVPQQETVQNRVDHESGCLRYRPQEVVAACRVSPLPAHFDEVEMLGKEALDTLKASVEVRQRNGRHATTPGP
jgi:hypothetical protein